MNEKSKEKFISRERLEPYLKYQSNNFDRAMAHYKANIEISKAFYPMLSVFEIGLRNAIDYQLTRRFDTRQWYDSKEFLKTGKAFQIDKISKTKAHLIGENKLFTPGRIVSELSFGFWTSFFDKSFENNLWKNLRFVFPYCPKSIRKRRTMSSKLNGIRKLRNRIFHHEPISWNYSVLMNYYQELSEGIDWLEKDALSNFSDIFNFNEIIESRKGIFTTKSNIGYNSP